MSKGLKIVLIILGLIIFISIIGASGGGEQKKPPKQESKPTPSQESESKKEEVEKEILKQPEPISLSGTGQQATEEFNLEGGLSIFKMTHSGGSNFIVYLLDNDGNEIDLLVNKIGVFDGSQALKIRKTGEYLLDISADGQWTVDIEQPRVNEAPNLNSFSGVGQQATELFSTNKGLMKVEMNHSGSSNFIVYLLDNSGNELELLVNEIGPFDGSKAVRIPKDGIYLFRIEADGEWQVDF